MLCLKAQVEWGVLMKWPKGIPWLPLVACLVLLIILTAFAWHAFQDGGILTIRDLRFRTRLMKGEKQEITVAVVSKNISTVTLRLNSSIVDLEKLQDLKNGTLIYGLTFDPSSISKKEGRFQADLIARDGTGNEAKSQLAFDANLEPPKVGDLKTERISAGKFSISVTVQDDNPAKAFLQFQNGSRIAMANSDNRYYAELLTFRTLDFVLIAYDKYNLTSSIAGKVVSFRKGVSLSPRSFQSEDFNDFLGKVGQVGSILSWVGDWSELVNVEKGAPWVLARLAEVYGYIPLIVVQFFRQSDGHLLRPLDETTKQSYKTSASAFAERYRPQYLGIGVEINILHERSPADFEAFAKFFGEVSKAVKEKSPTTRVFTVFQLEKMKGMGGGLFGGENDPKKAEWHLLEDFAGYSDVVAFTTYPDLIYKDPSDIPNDYYSEIRMRTSKPIIFTEIGWHADASPLGWESSEEEQERYVWRFFSLTSSLNMEVSIWSFVYDQNVSEPFCSMGLLKADGYQRPAWNAWVKA